MIKFADGGPKYARPPNTFPSAHANESCGLDEFKHSDSDAFPTIEFGSPVPK